MRAGSQYTLDDYEITEQGEVINKHNGHVRKPQPNSKGYLRVQIAGKNLFVHRLVAEKYVPNPNSYNQVNHIDGNKNNNAASNLEWVTNQENRDHAMENFLHLQGEDTPGAKLDWTKVNFIRENSNKYTTTELANMFEVSCSTIRDVIKYRTWKHRPTDK